MRTLGAAAAALTVTLLVAACAGPDTAGPAAEPSASPETSAAAADPVTTCSGYYDGGELSIHERVTTWGDAVAEPATEENLPELTIIRDRLAAQIRYAEDAPAAILESVQEPFTASIEGGSGDPVALEESLASLSTLCDEAGFVLPE